MSNALDWFEDGLDITSNFQNFPMFKDHGVQFSSASLPRAGKVLDDVLEDVPGGHGREDVSRLRDAFEFGGKFEILNLKF